MVSPSAPADATPPRDGLIALGIAALVAATILVAHLVPASPSALPPAPSADAACAEWSDGCRICQRTSEGVSCSTPGIACVPGAKSCSRRTGG